MEILDKADVLKYQEKARKLAQEKVESGMAKLIEAYRSENDPEKQHAAMAKALQELATPATPSSSSKQIPSSPKTDPDLQ